AVEAAENTGRVYSRLSAYENLVNFYLEREDYENAVTNAHIYYELDKQALEGDHMSTVNAQLLLADGYMGLKALDSAAGYIAGARGVLDAKNSDADGVIKLRSRSLEMLLYLNLYKEQQDSASLNKAYSHVAKLIDEVISGKAFYKHNESKLYYSESIVGSINTAMEVCHLKYHLSKDPSVINTIFKLMELNKSSVLLDGINDSSIKKELGVPDRIIEKQNSLEIKLADINKQIYTLGTNKEDTQAQQIELVNKRLAYIKGLDSITSVLEDDYPKYVEAIEFKQTEDLSYYQENTLAENQALVEYYINDTIIYRITVSKGKIAYDKIIAEKGWEQSVTKLRDQLIGHKEITSLSSELGTLLLPKLPSNITDIIFVLDRSLNQNPFEVLHYKEAPLVTSYNINYIGSLQLYEKQKEIGGQHGYNWVGFAPKYETASLFDNEKEVY